MYWQPTAVISFFMMHANFSSIITWVFRKVEYRVALYLSSPIVLLTFTNGISQFSNFMQDIEHLQRIQLKTHASYIQLYICTLDLKKENLKPYNQLSKFINDNLKKC